MKFLARPWNYVETVFYCKEELLVTLMSVSQKFGEFCFEKIVLN